MLGAPHPPLYLLEPGRDLVGVDLHHESPGNHLVQDQTGFLLVEDDVQLAHVLEALVKRLDVNLNEVKNSELRFRLIANDDEVQGREVPINHLKGESERKWERKTDGGRKKHMSNQRENVKQTKNKKGSKRESDSIVYLPLCLFRKRLRPLRSCTDRPCASTPG